jgi:hypothetical protein
MCEKLKVSPLVQLEIALKKWKQGFLGWPTLGWSGGLGLALEPVYGYFYTYSIGGFIFSNIVKYFCTRLICESLYVKDHTNKLIRVLGAGHGLFQLAQPGAEQVEPFFLLVQRPDFQFPLAPRVLLIFSHIFTFAVKDRAAPDVPKGIPRQASHGSALTRLFAIFPMPLLPTKPPPIQNLPKETDFPPTRYFAQKKKKDTYTYTRHPTVS